MKTNYRVATNWLGTSLIMCNNISEIDPTIWDAMRFNMFADEEDEDSYDTEIYQWFLTNCDEGDVRFLESHFDLKFTYSELLDVFVLCVDHYGTAWDYVYCETDLEQAVRELGESK